MDNLEERNNVDSKDQVDKRVYFEGKIGGYPRIMFVGNSITMHGPKPDIGWYGSWGMAASEKEKDYVHCCINRIIKDFNNASFCIVQASIWEREYKNCNLEKYFAKAKTFNPDIIVCSLSANILSEDFDSSAFIIGIRGLLQYLSGDNKAKIIISSSFFGNDEKNMAIEEYAKKHSAVYVYISDIAKDENNLAVNRFEHQGVQIHPGDRGMELLSERYLKQIYNILS